MKLTYENLDKVRLSKTGTFIKGSTTYYYFDACDECGEPFLGQNINDNTQFCCYQCRAASKKWRQTHSESIKGENNPQWNGGTAHEPYCIQWSDKEYKNWIKFERDGGECQNPNCYDISTKIVLHHINYDKKDCRPTNLITLCNSCNMRANFNREWHASFYQILLMR